MIDLSGRVALVTGSSRGIGRACALRLARAGADVVVNYLTSQAAAEAVAEEIRQLGRQVAVVKADISEREDVEDMIGFVTETFGQLDILVSNAASGGFRSLLDTSDRDFEAAMNTNVRPLLHLVQCARELLCGRSWRTKVVALSSHGSHLAIPSYGTMGASKAALEALIRHFALELGGEGVNFNVVKAGLVETDSTLQLAPLLGKSRHLTGERGLTAEDVADVVLFLCSPLSDLIQAEVVTVDGGAAVAAR